MVHLEGEIVHSFFEMALFSWYNALSPALTSLTQQLQSPQTEFRFGTDNQFVRCKQDLLAAQIEATHTIRTQNFPNGMAQHQNSPADAQRGMLESLLFPEGGLGKIFAVTKRLNTTLQPDTKATYEGHEEMSDFVPHIVHAPHRPFPIALMNRKPRGSLDYTDTNNPQDAAWLGGMRWAQKSIFIQTPTFNCLFSISEYISTGLISSTAPPAVEGVLAAVRRGVEVTLYLDIGFNDAAEKLWKQGGTNETVVERMMAALQPQERQRLSIHWYTGKDMRRPINAARKQRNCHIKLCIIDEQVGMQGNGNADSQSWFHSQESNIMVDSSQICKEWRAAIESNQNTGLFGKVQDDGIWRDPADGSLLESSQVQGGALGKLKGLKDTVRRATGNK